MKKNKVLKILICIIFTSLSLLIGVTSNASNLRYNYDGTEYYVIKLCPLEIISTKDDLIEGQSVRFKICDDVYVRGKKFLPKGTEIKARIETIVLPGRAGLPAELTIDNFEIPGINKSQLISEYTKQGQYKWWFRTFKLVIPPPVSIAPIGRFIKGGHAKITPKDIIIVKYFPDWK